MFLSGDCAYINTLAHIPVQGHLTGHRTGDIKKTYTPRISRWLRYFGIDPCWYQQILGTGATGMRFILPDPFRL